ncbi:TRAP transporter small permease [Ammoniphilus sp. CFH 90114]|uniref:TRAP transporter small permease n=1 Tax=Ammoniphilus sp. CFH 90114 TaxID=2493665 RepID=UPI00100E732B|nr:TRAP transporter small permease subunit [Ammoniphilus sp. CFH 90114]RXT07027.1 TRAP transporter small permease subunit [Ammoniphilus sp. CFH 90114]
MKKRWFQLIHNFENIITGFLLCTIITLLFIQVIARYVFGSAFSWTEEIARFGFLAMVYISASIGIQRGSHIRINAHILRFPEPIQKIIFLMGISFGLHSIFL